MQTIPKDQIAGKLGKGSFWAPINLVNLIYLYGIPELDAVREAKPSAMQDPLNLKVLPGGLEISIMHKFKHHTVGVPYSDIKEVVLEIPEDIVTKQERSVIGRAVIGGLLLGPIGAIIGGMSGLKDGQKAEAGDALLTIHIEQAGQESFFIAQVPKSKRDSTQNLLKKHLSQYQA